jgi:hypothetical protein
MARDIEQTPGYGADVKMRMPRPTDGDDVSELLIGETFQLNNGVAPSMVKAATDPGHFERICEFVVKCGRVCLEIDRDQGGWIDDDWGLRDKAGAHSGAFAGGEADCEVHGVIARLGPVDADDDAHDAHWVTFATAQVFVSRVLCFPPVTPFGRPCPSPRGHLAELCALRRS